MLNKLLALGFVALFVVKIFFRQKWGALVQWFDGLVNAMLIAIVLVYTLQLILWFTSRSPG